MKELKAKNNLTNKLGQVLFETGKVYKIVDEDDERVYLLNEVGGETLVRKYDLRQDFEEVATEDSRFIIHIHYKGKPNNRNFAGVEHDFFYGPDWNDCKWEIENRYSVKHIPIIRWNFRTKASACRAAKVHEQIVEEYWEKHVEVITVAEAQARFGK